LSQTEKNKGRFNVRVRQPLEFVEYKEGQQFMRVCRPISSFKSVDEKDAWKISAKLLERYEGAEFLDSTLGDNVPISDKVNT
jgi:hypothetical protein